MIDGNTDIDVAYLQGIGEIHDHILTKKHTEAVDLADSLIKEYPDRPQAYFMLALYAFSQRDFGNAIELLNSAHERAPECREYADCLAVLYTVTGKLSDGLYFAKLATTRESDPTVQPYVPHQLSNYFEALDRIEPTQHFVNAMLNYNLARYEEAVRCCELELKENDQHDLCHALLGKCQLRLGQYDKAVNALHAAMHINPDNPEAFSLLGTALSHLGRFDEATVCHAEALERDADSIEFATQAIMDAEFLPDAHGGVRNGFARALGERITTGPLTDIAYEHESAAKDRIRVAYVSNALRDCEQGLFILPVLEHHDRSRFEVYCYQQSIGEDSVNVELQTRAESWRNIYDLDDRVMSVIVGGDEIDVLVDLCGFTPSNRAQLFAGHPAPVQVAWLDPPFGVGSAGIDVVLTDAMTRDVDAGKMAKGQTMADMAPGLLALEPFTFLPDPEGLPAARTGEIIFGGQCDLALLTPETAALWSRVLGAVKGSRLLVGDAGDIPNAVKNQVIELFAHFGASDKIIFLDDNPDDRLRIDFYRQIDVLLDTTPVSGRMNLCRSLWMGVPVLTLKGSRRQGRVGASILNSARQDRWIASSAEHMVEIATALAGDLDGLAGIRKGLRDQVAASPLFNPKGFVEALEAVYVKALTDKGVALPGADAGTAPGAVAMPDTLAAPKLPKKASAKAKKPAAKAKNASAKAKKTVAKTKGK